MQALSSSLRTGGKKKSGESGYPCLISDFGWNGFSFSPFCMMLAILCWGSVLLFLVSLD
jgi:hypothetical protein